jgi:hypothetical protein
VGAKWTLNSSGKYGLWNAVVRPIDIAPTVSPWYASASPTNSHFSGRPTLNQYWAASLNAISVAVAPASE